MNQLPVISHGCNDLLYTARGQVLIDMFSAHGAVALGHAHPEVNAAIHAQLGRLGLAGGLPTTAQADAEEALVPWLGPSLGLAGLYSTGMEAAEFALRLSRAHTGRAGVVGFEGSMHGKSTLTAALGWPQTHGAGLPEVRRLPFLRSVSEEEALSALDRALADGSVGAVFFEPLQASNGGLQASTGWYRRAAEQARHRGALVVCDEILTGFHRTGPAFVHHHLGFEPDLLLFGKACGNGFPVAGVAARREWLPVPDRALPGSTFAGNPLAAAAVAATLRALAAIDAPARADAIADAVSEHLGWLDDTPVMLRGRGALWVIELPDPAGAESLIRGIYADGVCLGWTGRQFRIMPALTIEPTNLQTACRIVSQRLRAML